MNTTRYEELLTMKDLLKGFNVRSHMTIWAWRQKEEDPLPTIVIPGDKRDTIRFSPTEIASWAVRNNKPFNLDNEEDARQAG